MKYLRRLIYLGYYAQKMDWAMLRRFIQHTRRKNGLSVVQQVKGFLGDSLRYNITPLEWYQFGFPSLDAEAKATWAGTGTMFEFQRIANPQEYRVVLSDKRKFYNTYREFFKHAIWSIDQLASDPDLVKRILNEHEFLVFKDAAGNCGTSIEIHRTIDLDFEALPDWMKKRGFDMVEEHLEQHPRLQALSPSGVNTVRIFTLVDEHGDYTVLGCRLRISVDSHVDNLAAGNLAAPINKETGIVDGAGVYSDITRGAEENHPITEIPIEGFQVPFWADALELVRQASLRHPQNRSIGWDLVITPDGPDLIEGNHDWCKLVWQLPVKRGLKRLITETQRPE